MFKSVPEVNFDSPESTESSPQNFSNVQYSTPPSTPLPVSNVIQNRQSKAAPSLTHVNQ